MGNCSLKSLPDNAAKSSFDFIRIMTHSGEIIRLESSKLVGDFLIAFPGHNIFGQDHVSLPLSNQEYLVLGKSYYVRPSPDTCYNRCIKDLNLSPNVGCSGVPPSPVTCYNRCTNDLNPSPDVGCSGVPPTPDMHYNRCTKDLNSSPDVGCSGVPPSSDTCYNRCTKDLNSSPDVCCSGVPPSPDTCYKCCIKDLNSSTPDVGRCSGTNEKEPVRISSAALEIVTSLANGSGIRVLAPKQKGVWRVKLAISSKELEEILAEEVNTEALIEKMRMAAATDCFTPRRNKRSWGLIYKPVFANALKFPVQSTTTS